MANTLDFKKIREIRRCLVATTTKAKEASDRNDIEFAHYCSTEVRGMLTIIAIIDTDKKINTEFYEEQLPA